MLPKRFLQLVVEVQKMVDRIDQEITLDGQSDLLNQEGFFNEPQ